MRTSASSFVAVFGLGGTIAMARVPGGGVSPVLSASDLLTAVPGLGDLQAELRVEDFRNKPGASLDFPDLYQLAAAINKALSDGCVGAVVTQGTDTIEEVAYALDLLLPTDTPVVVTGAMRNPTMAGADGPANILAAIKVAASPCAGPGVPGGAQRSGPRCPLGPQGPPRQPCRLRLIRSWSPGLCHRGPCPHSCPDPAPITSHQPGTAPERASWPGHRRSRRRRHADRPAGQRRPPEPGQHRGREGVHRRRARPARRRALATPVPPWAMPPP
jgi:hypothetical protein